MVCPAGYFDAGLTVQNSLLRPQVGGSLCLSRGVAMLIPQQARSCLTLLSRVASVLVIPSMPCLQQISNLLVGLGRGACVVC